MNEADPQLAPEGHDSPAHATPQLPSGGVDLLGHDHPVFLVGMMGAGKTTVGKNLAKMLNREFVDLDHELEARCGVRIPTIFEIEGEEGFRKRECQVLDECTQTPGIVLATGGGAVLAPANRQRLKARGVVVYLCVGVDELFRRTSRDRNRPLLATPDPKGTLRTLLEQREPLYREVADLVIETGTTSVSHLVTVVIDQLKASPKFARLPENENPPCIP